MFLMNVVWMLAQLLDFIVIIKCSNNSDLTLNNKYKINIDKINCPNNSFIRYLIKRDSRKSKRIFHHTILFN